MTRNVAIGRVSLAMLFVTALVTAQLTAAKLLTVPLSLPYVILAVPGGALAYAVTFFASDCYAELYGRAEARALVNIGFVMIFVMLGLVWFTIEAPAAPGDAGVAPAQFRSVLGASTSVVLGSVCAYLVSQNWDVHVFHAIRDYTDGQYLWLRNVGSTATSQLLDTVIFIGIAFGVGPMLLQGAALPPTNFLLGLMLGQYLIKLGIAVVDTPFVYLVTRYLRETEFVQTPRPSD